MVTYGRLCHHQHYAITQDNWHTHSTTRSENMSWDALLPTLRLLPCSAAHPQSACGEATRSPSLEAGCGQLLLGLWVCCAQSKDYWCGLQGIQQRTGPHQYPRNGLHCAHGQDTVPVLVHIPLGTVPEPQDGAKLTPDEKESLNKNNLRKFRRNMIKRRMAQSAVL